MESFFGMSRKELLFWIVLGGGLILIVGWFQMEKNNVLICEMLLEDECYAYRWWKNECDCKFGDVVITDEVVRDWESKQVPVNPDSSHIVLVGDLNLSQFVTSE